MFRQLYEEKFMRFPEGRAKALTFSYDDGVKADLHLLEVFEKYGLKGTFNLNNLLFDCENWHGRMDEEQTYNAFKDGRHEVAVHGARHIFLEKVPLAEAVNEIISNRDYLEKKFGKVVRGMAYPYNSYNDEILSVLPALGIEYARTTESTHSFKIPENWLKLNPTCHHGDKALEELTEKFIKSTPDEEFKKREPLLFYIWGHSYEFDDNNNWSIIENVGKALGNRNDIWYATNIEIYRYVQAYNRLEFAVDGERVYNPSCIDVYIDLRGKIYKLPAGKEVVFEK